MLLPTRVIRDDERAQALVDPVRRRLIEQLRTPDSAAGVARRSGVPRQRINYHLRELERAGLVELVEERRKGNCTERIVRATAATYVISPEVLGPLATEPERIPDRRSSAYLVALAARMIRELAILRERAEAAGKPLQTLSLHADVRFASQAALSGFAEELANDVARLVAKYGRGEGQGETAPAVGGEGAGEAGGKGSDGSDSSAAAVDAGRLFRIVIGAHPAVTKTEAQAQDEAAQHRSATGEQGGSPGA